MNHIFLVLALVFLYIKLKVINIFIYAGNRIILKISQII